MKLIQQSCFINNTHKVLRTCKVSLWSHELSKHLQFSGFLAAELIARRGALSAQLRLYTIARLHVERREIKARIKIQARYGARVKCSSRMGGTRFTILNI